MAQGSIIGYDINPEFCQISVYNELSQEPETMEAMSEGGMIPLEMNYYKGQWTFGKNAHRMNTVKGSESVTGLLDKAKAKEKVVIDHEEFEAVFLLADFVGETLKECKKIDYLVFTVPQVDEDIRLLLKGIGLRLGISKENIYIEDYKESFCHYMFNQPRELWQYESALFYCNHDVISAYMLKELKTGYRKGKESFVTVEKVADAKMKELEAVYPVLNVDKAKAADEQFKRFIQSVFEKRMISSVFLTGEGFENDWYSNSRRVLCYGRRAFSGNNLFSRGACYTGISRNAAFYSGPVYLDETKMTEQISLKMRVRGEEVWYPLVSWGMHWYESDRQIEVLLEDSRKIEIRIDSLVTGKAVVEKVDLSEFPERKNYAVRAKISIWFVSDRKCLITFEDMGFGEFFPSTGVKVEKMIELGGSNGQFNTLS